MFQFIILLYQNQQALFELKKTLKNTFSPQKHYKNCPMGACNKPEAVQTNNNNYSSGAVSKNSIQPKPGIDMESHNAFDTIIIGAGMAGMTAAYGLAEAGRKVLVLQANTYMGGRIKTTNVPLLNNQSFKFEQGANWIHGSCKQHPITQLSKQVEGVKLIQTDDEDVVVYDQKGEEVDKLVDKQWDAYQNMEDKIQEKENVSMYKAIKMINSSKVQNKFFMYNMTNDVQFQTSGTLEDLSAEYGQDDSSYQGKQHLVVSGYQAFVQDLSDHKNIKVLLNHKVSKISYNGHKNEVKCENGHVFQSYNVVIAVPIGVLKKNSIKFHPQLPEWKQTAIKALHQGNVCKILIAFKKNIKIKEKQMYIGVVADDVHKRGAATYFLNLHSLVKIPAIMTFGLGPNSDELQFMPQAQLKQLIIKRMQAFVDQDIQPNDFQIYRSGWRGNPNFGGAYTFSGVQTKPVHWKNMAKPIFENRWYFCGEHTYSKYRGTVHGAYLSGQSVSTVILDEIDQKNWRYVGKSKDD